MQSHQKLLTTFKGGSMYTAGECRSVSNLEALA